MFTKSELILIHHVANGKADVQSLSESMGVTLLECMILYEVLNANRY